MTDQGTNWDLAQNADPDTLRQLAVMTSQKYNIPTDLFLGIAGHESQGWKGTALGTSGEYGVMQIMPETGRKLGLNITNDHNDDRWHPGKAMDAAARLLSDASSRNGGDWNAAMREYNTGKAASSTHGDSYIERVKNQALTQERPWLANQVPDDFTTAPTGNYAENYQIKQLSPNEEVNSNLGLPLVKTSPAPLNIVAPVQGEIASGFNDLRNNGTRQHLSTDILAPAGSPCVAPSDMVLIAKGTGGKNLNANDSWAWFKDTSTGVEYRFAHIDPVQMEIGDSVRRGDKWGQVGDNISGTHLHFMVYDPLNDTHIDWSGGNGLERGQAITLGQKLSDWASQIAGRKFVDNWGQWLGTDLPNWVMDMPGHLQDIEAGAREGVASTFHMLANATSIIRSLDSSAVDNLIDKLFVVNKWIGAPTWNDMRRQTSMPTSNVGQFIEDFFRGREAAALGVPEPGLTGTPKQWLTYGGTENQAAPERPGYGPWVTRTAVGLIPALLNYHLFTKALGPTYGFMAHDAIMQADQGFDGLVKGAISGLGMAMGLKAIAPLQKYQMFLGGSIIGGLNAAMNGGTADDIKKGAITIGALTLLGAGGQQSATDLVKDAYSSYRDGIAKAQIRAEILQGPGQQTIMDIPHIEEILHAGRPLKGETFGQPTDPLTLMHSGFSTAEMLQPITWLGNKVAQGINALSEPTPALVQFRDIKRTWLGRRNMGELAYWIESNDQRDLIRRIMNEKTFGPESLQMSKALLEYIDLQNKPELFQAIKSGEWASKYGMDKQPGMQTLVDLFPTIENSPELLALVDRIKAQSNKIGELANQHGIAGPLLDNYIARIMKFEAPPASEQDITRSPVKTGVNPRMAREFTTRWEARQAGIEYKVDELTENQRIYATEMHQAIEDKLFMDQHPNLFSEEQKRGWVANIGKNFRIPEWGGNITEGHILTRAQELVAHTIGSTDAETVTGPMGRKQKIGVVKKLNDILQTSLEANGKLDQGQIKSYLSDLNDPNADHQKVINELKMQLEGAQPRPDESVSPSITPEIGQTESPFTKDQSRSQYEVDKEGHVWLSKPTFSPKGVAEDMNNALGPSPFEDTFFGSLMKLNAAAKALKLSFGLFHAQAFTRVLLTSPDFFAALHPLKYRDAGLAEMNGDWSAPVRLGLEEGLLPFQGVPGDWAEWNMADKTIFGKLLDKNSFTKLCNDTLWKGITKNVDWTFHKFGNGLMFKYYMDTFDWARKQPQYQGMTDREIARDVAGYTNEVFGARSDAMLGKKPVFAGLESAVLLARNWTLSNMRILLDAAGGEGLRGELAQRYWKLAFAKSLAATTVLNLVTSMGDDKNQWERWCQIYESGKYGNFFDVDLTPLYRVAKSFCWRAGIGDLPDPEHKLYFGLAGHFMDAIKTIFDPVKLWADKRSIAAQMVSNAISGQDYLGRSFTAWNELAGQTGDDTKMPLKYSTVKDEPSRGPVGWSTLPSFAINQAESLLPIPLENFSGFMKGELDGTAMIIKDVGGKVRLSKELTPAAQGIADALHHMAPLGTPQSREEGKAKLDLMNQITREHDPEKFMTSVYQAQADGKLSPESTQTMIKRGMDILQNPKYGKMIYQFDQVAKENFGQALTIFEKANQGEREALTPVLLERFGHVTDPNQLEGYSQRMQKALEGSQ